MRRDRLDAAFRTCRSWLSPLQPAADPPCGLTTWRCSNARPSTAPRACAESLRQHSLGPACRNVTRAHGEPVRALSVRTSVAWGVGSAGRPHLRAVLVAIDRLSLLVTHFGVAIKRALVALFPPPIEPQGH